MSLIKVAGLVALMSAVDAVRVSMTDVNSDLEALMDKYDDAEKPKPQKKAATTSAGGPSKDDVQDMELKILQGNNDAEASQKAADDDFFNEVLSKHAQKSSSGDDILRMDDAKEAAEEVIERSETDPMKA